MVQQYNQNNINAPRGSQFFDQDAQLDLDADLVVVGTAGGVVTLTLPLARQIPGEEIKFKANDAGSTGNAVVIAASGGEDIDGNPTVSLTTDQASICLKSDGQNWRLVCDGGADGACCPPIIGRVAVGDPDDTEIIFPDGFIDLNILPDPAVLQFGVLKMDDEEDGGTAEVRRYPAPIESVPQPVVIAGPDIVAGAAGQLDRLRVTVTNAGLPDGGFWELVIINACGCCATYNLQTGAA